MNTPTISNNVKSVETIVQVARLSSVISPSHVADRATWNRKSLILARVEAGIDRKAAVTEFNAALAQYRVGLKATLAAVLSTADAVVTKERVLKSGDRVFTVSNHASKRIAAEAKITAKIEALQAKLATLSK